MRNLHRTIVGLLAGMGLCLAPALSSAQDLGVRGEAGIAAPLTAPQTDHYSVGGAFGVKGVIGMGSYFDIGPAISVVALSPAGNGPAGTAWDIGGTLRVKRPHDAKNTDKGIAAVSPWVDGDLGYVRTGHLDRVGLSVGAGLAWPTSEARNLWVGPYVRYMDIVQPVKPGFDNTDAHVFMVGISVELGPKAKKHERPMSPPVPVEVSDRDHDGTPDATDLCPDVPGPKENHGCPWPQPPVVDNLELAAKVQFAWDSAKLDARATAVLDDAVAKMQAHKGFDVRVEGHTSSEGPLTYNNKLSVKRAQAVVTYLVGKGVSKDRLTIKGLGPSRPVATNKTEAGRVLNRRAEFVVFFSAKKEGK